VAGVTAAEVKVRFFEDLEVGQAAERTITVGEADIAAFAAVSGDTNPVHLDEAYAQTTPFKGRVAHGMLAGAYISAVLGTELPGPGAIYLSQSLTFKRPVRIGDALVVRVEVKSLDPKAGVAILATTCSVGRKQMVAGEAEVLVPRRPAQEAPGAA
jgi:3-hydroxybutyryl-CoA dehydratase